jgi:uncharacterized protein (TIGR00730 family)
VKINELQNFSIIYFVFLAKTFIFMPSKRKDIDMKIAIFCSANDQIVPPYLEATTELGHWMAKNGHTLVYGGCNSGLMECIGKAVHEAGGTTIGVIPSLIEKGGRISDFVDVTILCDNLSDRKDLMESHSDIAIALPGGIGTLDEIFTLASSNTIGYHHKKVILYNIEGCWDALIGLLDDLQNRGMIRGDYHQQIGIATNLEQLQQLLG